MPMNFIDDETASAMVNMLRGQLRASDVKKERALEALSIMRVERDHLLEEVRQFHWRQEYYD